MKVIYKYPLEPGTTAIDLPAGAQALTVQMQGGVPHAWMLLDPAAPKTRTVLLKVYGTGEAMPDNPVTYLTTFQEGHYVWHVFLEEAS